MGYPVLKLIIRNAKIFYVILSNSCKAIFIIASIKESQFSEVNIFE